MTAIQAPPKNHTQPTAMPCSLRIVGCNCNDCYTCVVYANTAVQLPFFTHTLSYCLTYQLLKDLTLCILVRLALSSSGVFTVISSPSSSLHIVHLEAICQFVCPLLNHVNRKLKLGLVLRRIEVVFVQKKMDRSLRDYPQEGQHCIAKGKSHSSLRRAITFFFFF